MERNANIVVLYAQRKYTITRESTVVISSNDDTCARRGKLSRRIIRQGLATLEAAGNQCTCGYRLALQAGRFIRVKQRVSTLPC